MCRYIHLNPVEAELVTYPNEYEWSSHQYFINEKEKPSFLKTKMILDYVKSKSDFDYFVNLGVDKEISHFYNKKNLCSILGNDDFKKKVNG